MISLHCSSYAQSNKSEVTISAAFGAGTAVAGGRRNVIPDWLKRVFGRNRSPVALAAPSGEVTLFVPPTVAGSAYVDLDMLTAEAALDIDDSYQFTNDHFYAVAERNRRSWPSRFEHIEFDPD